MDALSTGEKVATFDCEKLADKMMIDEAQAAAESIIINYFNSSDAVIIIDNQLNNSKWNLCLIFYSLFLFPFHLLTFSELLLLGPAVAARLCHR